MERKCLHFLLEDTKHGVGHKNLRNTSATDLAKDEMFDMYKTC